nr:unnamed protein product [Spirometra erinaceieuropaei]
MVKSQETKEGRRQDVDLHHSVGHCECHRDGSVLRNAPRCAIVELLRLAPARHAAAKVQFEHMPHVGIVRQSEKASSLHMVSKAASGDWRPCGDYMALNNVTISDRYPVPHLQDFTVALYGKFVFSKIGLIRAFHQIPIAPANIPKTAVTTLLGLFGLRNASQNFQRFVDKVLHGLPFLYAYIDDLLIANSYAKEHMEYL